jgi:uncharacterized protein YbaR (Trm112 family)
MAADEPSRAKTDGRTDPRLLELLVCPLSKGPLEYDAARGELVSRRARLAYPIKSGVPLMTREAARSLDEDAKPAGSAPSPK